MSTGALEYIEFLYIMECINVIDNTDVSMVYSKNDTEDANLLNDYLCRLSKLRTKDFNFYSWENIYCLIEIWITLHDPKRN